MMRVLWLEQKLKHQINTADCVNSAGWWEAPVEGNEIRPRVRIDLRRGHKSDYAAPSRASGFERRMSLTSVLSWVSSRNSKGHDPIFGVFAERIQLGEIAVQCCHESGREIDVANVGGAETTNRSEGTAITDSVNREFI